MNTTIHWLTTALDGLVAFLPNLVAGLIILLVGWIIAVVLARATRAIAHRLGFDRLIAKLGLSGQPSTAPEARSASDWLGSIVYLIVMVVAVMQASRAWRLDFIANGLAAVIAYLPDVIAAAFIFAVALYAGNWVRDRFYRPGVPAEQAGAAATTGSRVLPEMLRAVIIAVGVFMALRSLQIAPEIVNAAFILTLGAMAVAGALAFGLGGREVAGRIAQSWWERRGGGFGTMTPPTGGAGRMEVSA